MADERWWKQSELPRVLNARVVDTILADTYLVPSSLGCWRRQGLHKKRQGFENQLSRPIVDEVRLYQGHKRSVSYGTGRGLSGNKRCMHDASLLAAKWNSQILCTKVPLLWLCVTMCHCESLPLRSYCQSWHHEPVPSMPCKRCHSPSISDVVKRFLVENMFLNNNYKLQTHAAPHPLQLYVEEIGRNLRVLD